jgi:hypothetical protein
MGQVILGTLLGYIAGVFTPGIASKIHAAFSKEVKKVDAGVKADVAKVEADAKADAAKIEKKL